jgi:hypothetical protein
MIDVRPDAMVANHRTAEAAADRSGARGARLWLLGMAAALALTVCTATFLLWGFYGPAYLLDLIAAYCG